MNEYEVATLAARYAGLWIAAAQVGIGLLQTGIVWYGIHAMQRMGATRAREQDQRHEEIMTKAGQHHEEAMTALNELIRASQPDRRPRNRHRTHRAGSADINARSKPPPGSSRDGRTGKLPDPIVTAT